MQIISILSPSKKTPGWQSMAKNVSLSWRFNNARSLVLTHLNNLLKMITNSFKQTATIKLSTKKIHLLTKSRTECREKHPSPLTLAEQMKIKAMCAWQGID